MRRSVMRFVRRRSSNGSKSNQQAVDAINCSATTESHTTPVEPNADLKRQKDTTDVADSPPRANRSQQPDVTQQTALTSSAMKIDTNTVDDTETKSDTEGSCHDGGSVALIHEEKKGHRKADSEAVVEPPPWLAKSNNTPNKSQSSASPPPAPPSPPSPSPPYTPPPVQVTQFSRIPSPPNSPPPQRPSQPPPPPRLSPTVLGSSTSTSAASPPSRRSSANSHPHTPTTKPPSVPKPPPTMPPPLTDFQRTVRARSVHQNMVASELKQRLEIRTNATKKSLKPVPISLKTLAPSQIKNRNLKAAPAIVSETLPVTVSKAKPVASMRQPDKETNPISKSLLVLQPAPPALPGVPAIISAQTSEERERTHSVPTIARSNSSVTCEIVAMASSHDTSAGNKCSRRPSQNITSLHLAAKETKEETDATWEQELNASAAAVRVVKRLPTEDIRSRTAMYLSPDRRSESYGKDHFDEFAAVRKAQRHLLRKDAEEARRTHAQQTAALANGVDTPKQTAPHMAVDASALIQCAPLSSVHFAHPATLLCGEHMQVSRSSSNVASTATTKQVRATTSATSSVGVERARVLQNSAQTIQRGWTQSKQRQQQQEMKESAISVNAACSSGRRGEDSSAGATGEYERARRGMLSETDKDLCLRLYETADGRGDGALTATNLAGSLQRYALRVRGLSNNDDARELVYEAKHEILSSLSLSPHDRLSPAHFVQQLCRSVRLHRNPSACLRLAMHLDAIGALGGQQPWRAAAETWGESWAHQLRKPLLGGLAVRALYRLFASVADGLRGRVGDGWRPDSVHTAAFVEQVAFLAAKLSAPVRRREGGGGRNLSGDIWVLNGATLRVLYDMDPGRTGRVTAAMLVKFVESNFASRRQSGASDMLLRLAGMSIHSQLNNV